MAPAPGRAFAPGQILGERYRVRAFLGEGGMGQVWHAFDLKLRVEVALKTLHRDRLGSRRALEMMRREVRAAREVISPNVCRIFDLVEVDGHELVSMEYIDGETLFHKLTREGALPLPEAREIASQFLAGLEAIHQAGLVHRDVKPENVMITRAGRVVLMDFGLAKPMEDGRTLTVAGTPAYMPPEQMRGEALDARADVFAAGIVLAEMVSSEGIAEHPSRESLWRGMHQEPPRVPETAWRKVLLRAVEKDPSKRYATAQELTRALEEATLRVGGADDLRPYPGLASFTEAEAEYFFGREVEVEQMWRKLRRPHLLALIGPSGAGKSSFLRAGLIPTLPEGWRCVVCTPGSSPLLALARAIVPELAGDTEAIRRLLQVDDPDAVVSVVSGWRRSREAALLIVDQFEELFTLNPPEVQSRFAEILGRLALEADVHVLLSLRDDFLVHCATQAALAPLFSELTPLRPLTEGALRRALVQPALKCGYRFEDEAMADEMLREVSGGRGAMPLLAFAAAQLWERRDRTAGLLTRGAFRAIGGVAGALAQHAEETLQRIGVERQPIVREIFRNLVTAHGTRAIRDQEDLLSVFADREMAEAVLRQLIDARLLTSFEVREENDNETRPRRRVEIIHESLLSAWPRLVRWQTQDADSAQIRDQLRQASQLWEERGRPADLLWSGSSYREFQLWRDRYPGGLSATEEAFTQAMTAQAGRRQRRRRLAVAGAFGLLMTVLAVVGYFWRQAVTAERHAEAQKLVALAKLQLETDPTEALAYIIASLELADTAEARIFAMRLLYTAPPARVLRGFMGLSFSPDGRWLAGGKREEGSGSLLVLPEDGGAPLTLSGTERDENIRAQWSPQGLLVAGAPVSERVDVWSFPEGQLLNTIDFGDRAFWEIVGGRVIGLARATDPGTQPEMRQFWSWSLPDGQKQELGRARWSREIAYHPEGSGLLYLEGGMLSFRPWPLENNGEDRALGALREGSGWTLFLKTARARPGELFTLDRALELRRWSFPSAETATYRAIQLPERIPMEDIGFPDPTGRWLIVGGSEIGHAQAWDLTAVPDAEPLALRRRGAWSGYWFAFHPAGDWLVARTNESTELTFWPLRKPYPVIIRGYSSQSRHLEFSPDGRWLASTWGNQVHWGNKNRLWPLPGSGSREVRKFSPWRLTWGFRFDPTGRRLLTQHGVLTFEEGARPQPHETRVALDQRLQTHYDRLQLDGGEIRQLEGMPEAGWGQAFAFSPSGRQVARASADNPGPGGGESTLRVWNLDTGGTRAFALPGVGREEDPDAPPAREADANAGNARGVDAPGAPAKRETVEPPAGEADAGSRGSSHSGTSEVRSLWFADEKILYTAGGGGLRRWDLDTGRSEIIVAAGSMTAVASADGLRVLAVTAATPQDDAGILSFHDLRTGNSVLLSHHGWGQRTAPPRAGAWEAPSRQIALDPAGEIAAVASLDGAIQVGPVTGGEPHLLVGHEGAVEDLVISPDRRWIASAGADATLRIWPMPDLSRRPLHTLPRRELLARLKSLTNLRAVEIPGTEGGWRIEVGRFPGWKEMPDW